MKRIPAIILTDNGTLDLSRNAVVSQDTADGARKRLARLKPAPPLIQMRDDQRAQLRAVLRTLIPRSVASSSAASG